jgi:hypothetical protein
MPSLLVAAQGFERHVFILDFLLEHHDRFSEPDLISLFQVSAARRERHSTRRSIL